MQTPVPAGVGSVFAPVPPTPEVQVILDPDDDATVTRLLLDAHDPAGGLVVVHPTPATRSATAMAADVLVALGRPANRGSHLQRLGWGSWSAAAAWVVADRIGHLVVLRAHLLSTQAWTRLLDLQASTDVRLVPVCHTRKIPHTLAAVLDKTGAGYRLLDRPAPETLREVLPGPVTGLPCDTQPGSGLHNIMTAPGRWPRLLVSSWPYWRAAVYRRLPAHQFAQVDAFYRHGLDQACRWLSLHPTILRRCEREAPGPTAADLLDAAGFLAELVHASSDPQHTLALMRGAQAGFLLCGCHLNVPSLTDATGPGLTTTPITPQIADRIRGGVCHPLLAAGITVALLTGISVKTLARLRLQDINPTRNAVIVPWPGYKFHQGTVHQLTARQPGEAVCHVPDAAWPLLNAAVEFHRLTGTYRPDQRLLAGMPATRIPAAAADCGVPYRYTPPGLPAAWQLRVIGLRVADPLHIPGRHPGAPHDRTPPAAPRDTTDVQARIRLPQLPMASQGSADLIHRLREHLAAHSDPEDLVRSAFPGTGPSEGCSAHDHDILFALGLTNRPADRRANPA